MNAIHGLRPEFQPSQNVSQKSADAEHQLRAQEQNRTTQTAINTSTGEHSDIPSLNKEVLPTQENPHKIDIQA
jgi:hypothetical protein